MPDRRRPGAPPRIIGSRQRGRDRATSGLALAGHAAEQLAEIQRRHPQVARVYDAIRARADSAGRCRLGAAAIGELCGVTTKTARGAILRLRRFGALTKSADDRGQPLLLLHKEARPMNFRSAGSANLQMDGESIAFARAIRGLIDDELVLTASSAEVAEHAGVSEREAERRLHALSRRGLVHLVRPQSPGGSGRKRSPL